MSCYAASREDIQFIMKNPEKHQILEVNLEVINMKNGRSDGKYSTRTIGKKLGYKMACTQKNRRGKIYGCTAGCSQIYQLETHAHHASG